MARTPLRGPTLQLGKKVIHHGVQTSDQRANVLPLPPILADFDPEPTHFRVELLDLLLARFRLSRYLIVGTEDPADNWQMDEARLEPLEGLTYVFGPPRKGHNYMGA